MTEGNAAYEAKQVEEGFRAYRSTVQSLAAGTATKIIWDTEVRDDGADYDPATGEWTVPATGWYDVAAGLYFASLADGNQVVLQVYVNGTSHTRLTSPYTGAAGSPMVSGAVPLHLTAGDVVSVYAVRSSAGDVGGTSLPSVLNYFTAKRRY